MALSDFNYYMNSCQIDKSSESVWHTQSDFGECEYVSDTQLFPGLTPVYNGKVLDIQTELVHAALCGISIKHYNGKCFQVITPEDENESEFKIGEESETFGFNLFNSHENSPSSTFHEKSSKNNMNSSFSTSSDGTFEYREDFAAEIEGKPVCTNFKINYRNSFWNLHRPELCKLTWPQMYVSSATVTQHLHDHLTEHGPICKGIHLKEESDLMLSKELDEYGRLKELAPPRKLLPDEKVIHFKIEEDMKDHEKPLDPRCRKFSKKVYPRKIIHPKERFLVLNDSEDDDLGLKKIHRSKEEFCLTIGKHVRKAPVQEIAPTIEEKIEEIMIKPEAEEEEESLYYYDWPLYEEENSLDAFRPDSSLSEIDIEPIQISASCPPLLMDEFCRAAAKADFSDLRCNPDF